MRKALGLSLLALTTFTLLGLGSPAHAGTQKFDVKVKGMTCEHCAAKVKSALEKVPGLDPKSVQVEVSKMTATFRINSEDKNLNDQVQKAIETTGYHVTMINGVKVAEAAPAAVAPATDTKKN